MECWLVQAKRVQMAPVELREKAMRLPKMDPPSPRLRRASWRPPLLAAKQTPSPEATVARYPKRAS